MSKKQRNECDYCKNFIQPVFKENYSVHSNAKCKLGKRVTYQIPIPTNNYYGGYYTYCVDFNT